MRDVGDLAVNDDLAIVPVLNKIDMQAARPEEIKEEIRNFLANRLKLELSVEKTLITHARTETARFLGYEVGVMD